MKDYIPGAGQVSAKGCLWTVGVLIAAIAGPLLVMVLADWIGRY
ncbi:hypothetical protein [Amycolatopsis thermoflava]|nr:hypothetical protein [Amycolatopsis thermoflava]